MFAVISCDKKADDIIEEVSLSPEIVVYEPDFIDQNYLFLIENGGTSSYLINKQGDRLWTWNFDDNLGNDIELLENGQLLGIFKDDNRPFSLGGGSGIIKLFETNGSNKNFMNHRFLSIDSLPNNQKQNVEKQKIRKRNVTLTTDDHQNNINGNK
jgi:hypothetical protein